MPTYLVLRRIKEDRVALPGELLTDLPISTANLLIARGYIIPVPDNYPGAVSKPLQLSESPSSDIAEASETSSPTNSPLPLDGANGSESEPESKPRPKAAKRPEPTQPSRPVARARVTRRR